jgi:hypothetical protein
MIATFRKYCSLSLAVACDFAADRHPLNGTAALRLSLTRGEEKRVTAGGDTGEDAEEDNIVIVHELGGAKHIIPAAFARTVGDCRAWLVQERFFRGEDPWRLAFFKDGVDEPLADEDEVFHHSGVPRDPTQPPILRLLIHAHEQFSPAFLHEWVNSMRATHRRSGGA